ncbi:MAG: PAS domain S-box protein [Bacteroidales bacterium]|jgi:PAS domain S-box-containing protein|nr:PAS domain S-box protein [Bacteroidales bacterium]MDY0369698.1 PAS domain S-box protein [Bacteroidales bacterium]
MIQLDLIYNLAVLVALSVFSGFIDHRYDRKTTMGKILQGLLFGLAAIVGMMYPFHFMEGMIFDGRSIVISVAAYFFGPLSGLISAIMAVAYRLYLGGVGIVMGSLVILTAYLIGSAFYFHIRRSSRIPSNYARFYMLGVMVHLVMMLLILTLPSVYRAETFYVIGFTVLGIYPIVTIIIAKILLDQEATRILFTQLSDSEQFFRTSFFSIADGILITDTQGKILKCNPIAEKLIGKPSSELIGKKFNQIVNFKHADPASQVKNPIDEALRIKGVVNNDTFFLEKADGKLIPLIGSTAPITQEAGNIIGTVMVFNDSSKDLNLQQQWVLSSKAYQVFFNRIKATTFILNQQGIFIDVNEGVEKMYGYKREELIGKPLDLLSVSGLPDSLLIQQTLSKVFEGHSIRKEVWGKRKNGEVFPISVIFLQTNFYGEDAILAIARDTSDEKNIAQALRFSEERYRTLFEYSPLGILLEDLDGTILEVNQTFTRLYGYSAKELIGQHVRIIAPESHKHLVEENIKSIIKNKILISSLDSITKQGTIRQSRLIETLVSLPDGKQGILSISEDISDQVRAEQKKAETESRFKAILSLVPDIYFRFDGEGRYIDGFTTSTEMLIAPMESMINSLIYDVLPPSLAKTTKEYIQKTIETGELHEFDYSLGEGADKQWYNARMIKSGSWEVLTILQNITDRKLSEIEINKQKYFIETLLDSIPNPIFYLNTQGVYLGINKAFQDWFGVSKTEIIGKTLLQIDPHEVALRNIESDQRIFDGIDQVQSLDREMILPTGEKRTVILNKSPFHDEIGQVSGLIGLIVDITERKKIETDLMLARNKALESDRLKTSFLNNLNHEIRTPLNAIVGFSNLLNEAHTPNEQQHFVNVINNNSEQLLRIIDDVLAVSRLESEIIPLDKKHFNIKQLLTDLKHTLTTEAYRKGLLLIVEKQISDISPTIFHDKGKVRQILAILITNAIKYTLEGRISIGFTANQQGISFFVKDTGIGIPENEQALIFDRFFRGEESQNRAIRGTGLGLNIANTLAKLMGGSIHLESKQGIGTTFYFELPCEVLISSTSELIVESTFKKLSALRILIAEDEQNNFDYLNILLKGNVRSIDHAKDGAEVLEKVQSYPYDLILMDLKMPRIDGLEATKLVLAGFPDMIIIAQTAYSQPDEINKALEAGCHDFLIKPIEKEKLFAAVQKIFEKN